MGSAIERRGSDGLGLRSVDAVAAVRTGWQRLRPRLLDAIGLCRDAGMRLSKRLAGIDIVPALIGAVDGIETALRWITRLVRHWLPRRGPGLAETRAWRGVAALSGIGLAVALITGLSAKDEDQLTMASLASAAASFPMQDGAAPRRPRAPGAAEEWMTIQQPMAMFSLEAPELGRAAPSLEARRSPDGSRREDLLSFGSLTESKPHLLLRLATGEGAAAGTRSFTVALVHDAAQRSLAVERSSTPAAVKTRFGPLETADVLLGDGTQSRSCIAFRTPPGDGGFALSGWWCASSKPSDRRQLTCLVDRLDLVGTAADRELRSLFAGGDVKRQPGCGPQPDAGSLAADGEAQASRARNAGAEIAQIPPERPKSRTRPIRRQP